MQRLCHFSDPLLAQHVFVVATEDWILRKTKHQELLGAPCETLPFKVTKIDLVLTIERHVTRQQDVNHYRCAPDVDLVVVQLLLY